MLNIGDAIHARMWAEKARIVTRASAVGLVLAALMDWVWTERHVAVVIVSVCVLGLVAMLVEMRYRMSKGKYGERTSEQQDLERWLKNHGARRYDNFDLPG